MISNPVSRLHFFYNIWDLWGRGWFYHPIIYFLVFFICFLYQVVRGLFHNWLDRQLVLISSWAKSVQPIYWLTVDKTSWWIVQKLCILSLFSVVFLLLRFQGNEVSLWGRRLCVIAVRFTVLKLWILQTSPRMVQLYRITPSLVSLIMSLGNWYWTMKILSSLFIWSLQKSNW